jgi:hypothetical protein
MRGGISVANLPNKGANGGVYIGRTWRGVPGSPLGNPRVVGRPCPDGGTWTAGATLPYYERELRALDRQAPRAWWGGRLLTPGERDDMRRVMNDLYRRVRDGDDLVLDSHCKPRTLTAAAGAEHPCHGDVVANLIEEALARRSAR